MKIKIKDGLEIGDSLPPFIIAEIGSNWRNLEDCLFSIHMAKACGADAVKFQAFTHESLYGQPDPEGIPGWNTYDAVNGLKKNTSVKPYSLPLGWLPSLKEKADQCGIEFMCSAFSPELVEAVDPFVNIHKVASSDLTHVRILEKLRQIGKPVILSTGASGAEDIKRALRVLRGGIIEIPDKEPCEVVLMYCVSAYPALEIDLGQISYYRECFNTLVGYSDHSRDVRSIPQSATNRGASVIEKHVSFISADTPDSPHSLSADQFRAMVGTIRSTLNSLRSPTPEEKPMILRHNRRLIATKKIVHGEELQEGYNFGIYRSLKDETHAFSPFMIDEVNGRRALKVIEAGDGIGPGDV